MNSERFFRARMRSVKIALDGIRQVFITQQNAKIHAFITLLVFISAGLFKFSRLEWTILALVVGLVWVAEIFNTAVEMIVDLVSPEKNPTAKMIKDISAGAVLLSAMISILIGILLFAPRLWHWVFP